jgi:DNA (cytosine-5)-methyltransferase 1
VETIVSPVEDVNFRQFDGIFLLHASPPCQNFSIARSKAIGKHADAEAGSHVLRAVKEASPVVVTIENVRGYVGSQPWRELSKGLQELGYIPSYDYDTPFEMAKYGVPQSRVRIFAKFIRRDRLQYFREVSYQPALIGGREGRESFYWFGLEPRRHPRNIGWLEAIADIVRDFPKKELPLWVRKEIEKKGIEFRDRALLIPTVGVGTGSFSVRDQDLPTFTIRAFGGSGHWCRFKAYLPDLGIVEIPIRGLQRFMTVRDDFYLPQRKSDAGRILGNGVPVAFGKEVFSRIAEQYEGRP